MPKTPAASLHRRIADLCHDQLAPALPPREAECLRTYLLGLVKDRRRPPQMIGGFDCAEIAQATGMPLDRITAIYPVMKPALLIIDRDAPRGRRPSARAATAAVAAPNLTRKVRGAARRGAPETRQPDGPPARRRPGRKPLPIVECPEPISETWDDPAGFGDALKLHAVRHGETVWQLHRSVVKPGETLDRKTMWSWAAGEKFPRTLDSYAVLRRIERRYRLPDGYFKAKLPHPGLSAYGHSIPGINPAERRRLAWHLPDDFAQRPTAEQEEILEWVRRVIIRGSTDYRDFQAAAVKHRYGLRFPGLRDGGMVVRKADVIEPDDDEDPVVDLDDPELPAGAVDAPAQLAAEMALLLRFKTSTLAAVGFKRNGVWGEETADQKVEHLGLLFGALAASPRGAIQGQGVPLGHLTFALLAIPAVWDWYIQWRERRRGFYTRWELDMLQVAAALTRKETGWLRQRPGLAARLRPVSDLVTEANIEKVVGDWPAACDELHAHALARAKEVQRVVRVHRDPFEPILAVLEADSPVAEYRKITDEILRMMPDERRYRVATAEAVRGFLMLRFGLHLGLRQKNLRQLLLCPRGTPPRTERQLVDLKRDELRWSNRDNGWEVFIPAVAFKNAGSSFFASKPYRLVLPDVGDLYRYIDDYVKRHRRVLLRGVDDPGTFFVKTVCIRSKDASYDQGAFYDAWRLVIQRYGIYNPYTERGVIRGLLPHGPHNIRDVLATHILKQTGSYEQASYAIQDTPEIVAKHYGRFLPQDKAALAAQVLNKVWQAAE